MPRPLGRKEIWMDEHWDGSTPESGDQSVCNKAATVGYGVVTIGGWEGALVSVLHCRCGGTCRNIK